jgi:23S rRNA (cytosine1962-C5)-methyltransferase
LLHNESKLVKIDQYGDVLAIYWYVADRLPMSSEEEAFQRIVHLVGATKWILYPKEKNNHLKSGYLKDDFSWTASEGDLSYQLRSNHGASPGLFTDQREQRFLIRNISQNARVLNLFCYTSGFSLNALQGGADQVVSVDSSASALDWSKTNVLLNNLELSRILFWRDDVRKVLKRLISRSDLYDIVICDPPTFSYGKNKPFVIGRELRSLIQMCMQCVAKGGSMFFSINYEGMALESFLIILKDLLRQRKVRDLQVFNPTFDYMGCNGEEVTKGDVWSLKSVRVQFD